MPVVISRKNRFQGVVTPLSLGSEVTVVEFRGASDDYVVEGYIDLRELDAGDTVGVCEYIGVDGAVPSAFLCAEFSGKQEQPVIRFHTKTLLSTMIYKVIIKQLYGYLKPFYYAFIQEVMGEV